MEKNMLRIIVLQTFFCLFSLNFLFGYLYWNKEPQSLNEKLRFFALESLSPPDRSQNAPLIHFT